MLLLFISIFSPSLAVKCPRPAVPDGGILTYSMFVEDNETMVPGEVVKLSCAFFNSVESVQMAEPIPVAGFSKAKLENNLFDNGKTCQEDGTWKGESVVCGRNVAQNLPLNTSDGFFSSISEKFYTEWETSLLSPVDIGGVRIVFKQENNTEDSSFFFTAIISNSHGRTKSCKSPVQEMSDTNQTNDQLVKPQEHYSVCDFTEAESIKIVVNVPIQILSLKVIAFNIGSLQYVVNSLTMAPFLPTYYVGNTFLLSFRRETFAKARENCLSIGAELLENYTEKEWMAISHTIQELSLKKEEDRGPNWIGLSSQKGIWRWDSGAVLSHFNMPEEVVFTAKPAHGLAIIAEENEWTAASQSDKYHFICRLGSKARYSCMNPGTPEGGYYVEGKRSFVYKCIEGYKLVGQADRICSQKTGQFASEMPRCEKEK